MPAITNTSKSQASWSALQTLIVGLFLWVISLTFLSVITNGFLSLWQTPSMSGFGVSVILGSYVCFGGIGHAIVFGLAIVLLRTSWTSNKRKQLSMTGLLLLSTMTAGYVAYDQLSSIFVRSTTIRIGMTAPFILSTLLGFCTIWWVNRTQRDQNLAR